MADPLTPERIAELRALERSAGDAVERDYHAATTGVEEFRFVRALRNAAPALLDAAEALVKAQARIAELEADNAKLRADLDKEEVSQCESCGAPLYADDDYVSDPDGVSGCWHAMSDKPPKSDRQCYAYRVGKEDARRAARLLNQGGGE